MTDTDKHELLLALSDIRGEIMLNRTLIMDVRDHQEKLEPRVNANDKRLASLEQSRMTALAMISALWVVVGGSFINWFYK